MIPKPTTGRGAFIELVLIVALAIGLALAVQAYTVKPYQIPSGSMEPTLDIGQRVLVNRFSTRLGDDPETGDIVVFHPPVGATEQHECGAPHRWTGQAVTGSPTPRTAEENFIKRVVAGPGDTLHDRRTESRSSTASRSTGRLGQFARATDPVTATSPSRSRSRRTTTS